MDFNYMASFSLKYVFKRKQILTFFIPYIFLSVFFNVLSVFFFAGESIEAESFSYSLPSLAFTLLLGLASLYAVIGVTLSAHHDYQKKKWDTSMISNKIMGILPRLIAYNILFFLIFAGIALLMILPSLVIGLPGLLILLPGLLLIFFLGIRLYLGEVILIVEDSGVIESLERSYRITEKKLSTLFLYLLGFSIIIFLLTLAVYLVMLIPGIVLAAILMGSGMSAQEAFKPVALILSPLDALFNSYYTSASAVFTYLLYQKIKKEKSGEERIKAGVEYQVKEKVTGYGDLSEGNETN